MENHKHGLADAVGAGVLVALLTSFALIAAGGWSWFAGFLSSQAASWVQAIGAVIAVMAAFNIGRTQIAADRALEASRRAHDAIHRLSVVDAILRNFEVSLELMRSIADKFEMPVFIGFGFENQILDASETVKAINLFDCPATAALPALAMLPRQSKNLCLALEAYNRACDDCGTDEIKRELPNILNQLTLVTCLVSGGRSRCQEEIAKLSGGLT